MKVKNFGKKAGASALLALTLALNSGSAVFAQTIQVKDLTSLKNEIINNMVQRNTTFTINYVGDTQEFLQNISKIIKEAYSSDDYLRWSWSNYNTKISGYYGNINATFNFSYYTTKEQEDYINQQTQLIVNQLIKNDMSDYEKVKILNDYVTNLVDYDKTLQKRTAYDALVYKSAVCQGYANLLDKLLEKAGIESIIVGGSLNGTPHAWNLVKVDGNWYHVDATNNDVTNNKYFLVSDNFLMQNNFTWDREEYPSTPSSNYVYVDKALEEAKAIVTRLENEKTEELLNLAIEKVNVLKPSSDKDSLIQRINVVKQIIEENKKLSPTIQIVNNNQERQTTNTEESINVDESKIIKSAEAKIKYAETYISDATLKTALMDVMSIKYNISERDRLMNMIFTIIDKQINITRQRLLESQINKTKSMIDIIPDEYKQYKEEYMSKLNELIELRLISVAQTYINSYKNNYFSTTYLKNALDRINDVSNITAKQQLMDELAKAVHLAINYTERYRGIYVQKAYEIVNLLPNDMSRKVEFMDRLARLR